MAGSNLNKCRYATREFKWEIFPAYSICLSRVWQSRSNFSDVHCKNPSLRMAEVRVQPIVLHPQQSIRFVCETLFSLVKCSSNSCGFPGMCIYFSQATGLPVLIRQASMFLILSFDFVVLLCCCRLQCRSGAVSVWRRLCGEIPSVWQVTGLCRWKWWENVLW